MSRKNTNKPRSCINKFLNFFPKGFQDTKYADWERTHKWETHERWNTLLNKAIFAELLQKRKFDEVCKRALQIESKTYLLFSFEKMAIRDALKTPEAQRLFAKSLFQFLYNPGDKLDKFEKWCHVIAKLPRKQTRVVTWPILTIFGFLARPDQYIYFKPMVTRNAALAYGFDLVYKAPISLETYKSFLAFTDLLRRDLKILKPKDLIDIQSFIWVLGSAEYE